MLVILFGNHTKNTIYHILVCIHFATSHKIIIPKRKLLPYVIIWSKNIFQLEHNQTLSIKIWYSFDLGNAQNITIRGSIFKYYTIIRDCLGSSWFCLNEINGLFEILVKQHLDPKTSEELPLKMLQLAIQMFNNRVIDFTAIKSWQFIVIKIISLHFSFYWRNWLL